MIQRFVYRLIAISFIAFVFLSSAVFFIIAVGIWLATVLFDKRLWLLHQFTSFWASLYIWVFPPWSVSIEGKENIDPNDTYVIVSNHQSLVDILVAFTLFTHFKWVSKAELFRIPLIGWNMSLNQYVKLWRGESNSIKKMYRACERHLNYGSSVFLFPEGTRSESGRMRPFKEGAFVLAKRLQKPILPLVINGSSTALPKNSFNFHGKTHVRVTVLPPIPPEQFGEDSAKDLADRIQKIIGQHVRTYGVMNRSPPIIYYGLQPTLLIVATMLWLTAPDEELIYPIVLLGCLVLLGGLEYIYPARPHWLSDTFEASRNIALVLVLTIIAVLVAEMYRDFLREPLFQLRHQFNLNFWPHSWPLLLQVIMVFLLAELIWYWMHRAEHRFRWVWRLSGHGAHHSFKHLGSLNFGLNHPLEYFLIVLPTALVELTFGVGQAAAGAAVITLVQTIIVHSNIAMNSKLIGWLFTSNQHHICHHSANLEESNRNYGCSTILWDRLFGTFLLTNVTEAGTGPTEPSTWQKLLMPLQEPLDTAIAPE